MLEKISEARAHAEEVSRHGANNPLEDIKGAWRVYGKLRSKWKKRLKRRKTVVYQKHMDLLDYPDQFNPLSKTISAIKRKASGNTSALDPDKLPEYRDHFLNTFGAKPSGKATQYNIDVLEATDPHNDINLRDVPVSNIKLDDVEFIIKSMTSGKAPGSDTFGIEIYKKGGDTMLEILTTFFKICEEVILTPSIWRQALVALIYKKKGDIHDICNYRPISLTCVLRRVFEQIFRRHYIDRLSNRLHPSQGGFRHNRSTYDQIFILHEALVRNKETIAIFLDIKAAYDTVDRRILWTILSRDFDFSNIEIMMLRSLFDLNVSMLVLKGKLSEAIKNLQGLMQGSSESPNLFNAFINRLVGWLQKCKHKLSVTPDFDINNLFFADDAVLLCVSIIAARILLKICEKWSLVSGITFSPRKCAAIFKNIESTDLCLYNEPIAIVDHYNYLGLELDKYGLNFNLSIENRIKKTLNSISVMRNIGMNVYGWRLHSSAKLYKLFLRSMMEYGLGLVIFPKGAIKKLQAVQNTALRTIAGVSKSTSIEALHTLFATESMEYRNQVLNMKYFKKITETKADHPVGQLLQKLLDNDNASTKKGPAKSFVTKFLTQSRWKHILRSQNDTFPDKKELEELRLQFLQTTQENSGIITRRLPPIESIYGYTFTRECRNLPRENVRALLQWKLNRLSTHQPCSRCGAPVTSYHSIKCSKSTRKLVALARRYKWKKNYRTSHGRLNLIDSLMWQNEKRKRIKWNLYLKLSNIILNIKEVILGHKIESQDVFSDDDDPSEYYNKKLKTAQDNYIKNRKKNNKK
jgi:hypothetical protein